MGSQMAAVARPTVAARRAVLIDDVRDRRFARSAAGSSPTRLRHVLDRASALVDGSRDIAVGGYFAEADDHGWLNLIIGFK
jgi:hypothetical protein